VLPDPDAVEMASASWPFFMVDDPSPPEVPGDQRSERLHSGLAGHFQPEAHTKYPKLPSFDPMCFPR
jgi:hypothetical protein